VSHATAHALSAPGLSALHCARAARERGLCPAASQAGSGLHCPGLFGTVARPQQAERALCMRAELSFGPEAV
jgi:hypothetical protein